MSSPPRLLTTGQLATELRQPVHRILYVLSTRRHIQPSALSGVSRVYDSRAKAQLRHELSAIDARRAARGEGTRHE